MNRAPVPGSVAPGLATPSGIGDVLVSCRSAREYRAMFALTATDMSRRILDCSSGAAGFTATAAAAGCEVWACDPMYAASLSAIDDRSGTDLARAAAYVGAHPEEYGWSFFTDLADYQRERSAARAAFMVDYRDHRHRYVAARLPHLPFRDGAFDLVLCSHLLFSWADRLDTAFHHQALRELTRVGTRVRVFPLFAMGAGGSLDLGPLLRRLRDEGIAGHIRDVEYQFQLGRPALLEVTQL